MAARARRPAGFLSSLFRRAEGSSDAPMSFELVVVEGPDEGARFALDQPEIQIGRGDPANRRADQVLLNDRSVSSKHAIVSCEAGEVTISHLPSATNPTLVNGRRIKQRDLKAGDQIVIGLVVMELRALASEVPEPPQAPPPPSNAPPAAARVETGGTSLARSPDAPSGQLVVTDGVPDWGVKRFPLDRARTTIGRSENCDITIPISAISRRHAARPTPG